MLVEASAVLIANLEAIGLIGALGVGFEMWKQQRFARNLAKDINQKYKNYRGKGAGDCDRLLRQRVEALCVTVRSNINKQHETGAIDVKQTRKLVGLVDSMIKDVRHSPRGRPWKAGWSLRRKLGKLDRMTIDALLVAIACSREGQRFSSDRFTKHIHSAGEALTRRSLLVIDTGGVQ